MACSLSSFLFRQFAAASVFAFALTSMSSTASAIFIDFTSAEGYVAGPLVGQPGSPPQWAEGGTSPVATVDPTGTGVVDVTSMVGGAKLSFDGTVPFANPGDRLIFSHDYNLTVNSALVNADGTNSEGNANTALRLYFAGIGESGNAPTPRARVDIFKEGSATGWKLNFFNTGGGGFAQSFFNESAIGVNAAAGDLTTDQLRLTIDITRNATTSWPGSYTLTNLYTNTEVSTKNFNLTAGTELAAGTEYFAGFQGVGPTPRGGLFALDSLKIDNFSLGIPEPGSLVLGGLSMLCLAGFRRRNR